MSSETSGNEAAGQTDNTVQDVEKALNPEQQDGVSADEKAPAPTSRSSCWPCSRRSKKKAKKPKEELVGPKRISLLTMFKFATPLDWFLMLCGGICGLGHGIMMPLFAIILGNIFDALNSSDVAASEQVAIKFCYLGAAAFFASFGQVSFFTITAERMTVKLRRRYLESILKQEVGYFDQAGSGTLVTRLSENSLLFREALGDKLGSLFQFFAMFVGGLAVGFSFSWQLTLVIFAFLPLMALAGSIMGKAVRNLTSGQLDSYAKAGSVAEETFQLFRTVTSYGLQMMRIEKYGVHLKYAEDQASKQGLSMGVGFGLMLFSVFITYSINVYLGAVLVTNSRNDAASVHPPNFATMPSFCTVGGLIPQNCSSQGVPVYFENTNDICNCAFCQCGCYYSPTPGVYQFDSTCFTGGDVMLTLLSVIIGSFALGQAAPSLAAFSKGKAATEQLLEIIDRMPLIDADSTEGEEPALPVRGAIEFKDVSFAYPTRLEYPVFKNFNMTIAPGKRVAFVGESGCGKSTIIALLQRWYDPLNGSIKLDGKDIRSINIKRLRSVMGLVSQEPLLFSTTIRQNIKFGRPDATDEEIIEAAKTANAHEFIARLPDGYDTFVTSSLVSGGQRQRLCLSRAMLRNPPILLLDEATSALDNESERIVNESIQHLLTTGAGGSRTTIVIAHRLSSIQACDVIYVFEKGRVVESGAHQEILDQHPEGVYASFIKLSSAAAHKHEEHAGNAKVTMHGQASFIGKSDGLKSAPTLEAIKDADADTKSSASTTTASALTTSKKKKKEKKYPIRKAFTFAYEDRWLFIPAVFGSSVYGITFPVYAVLLSRFLSTYFLMNTTAILSQIVTWSWAFFGLACAMGLSMTLQNWMFGTIGGRMTTRVRRTIFHHLLSMEVGFYDEKENSVGVVAARLGTDAAMVKGAVSDRVQLAVSNLASIIAGFTIAFIGSWKVALVVIATFPALVASGAAQMMLMGGLANSDKKALELAGHTISESVYGIRTVTSFSMQTSIKDLYYDQLKGPMKAANRKGVVTGIAFAFSQCMQFFIFALTFWYGSTLVAKGEIYFGDLIQAIMGIFTAAMAVGQAAALAPDVGRGGAAVQSIFKMLERKSKIDPFSTEGKQPSTLLGDVSFEDITFAYPTRPNVTILSGFSLNIPRGQTVAFVGSSGSGKSTLVLLLERFYDPGLGSVKLDGVDIRDLNPAWLRSQIGIVSQEPALFRGTVLDNIRAGRVEASDEECIEAAKMANAHDFIMKFPDGYQTDLETASSTSGGQKQRIAIARCLVRSPKILLLDEATSALDEESQRVVQAALDKLLESSDRTTIVVAHRLSTVRNANTIVVLQYGVVVEMGSFDDLSSNPNGAFSALLKSQSH